MRYASFLGSLWILSLQALRDSYEDALIPDYSEHYYYHNLADKMAETMSINNCTIHSDSKTGFESKRGDNSDFSIQIIPPASSVTQKWGTEGNEQHSIAKLFMRVTENLCSSKPFLDYRSGRFKNSKGCQQMYRYDRSGNRTKVIKRYGATLHPEHIRCSNKESARSCVPASKRPEQLPTIFRSLNTYPFLIRAQNVIVARSGFLSLNCGPVGLFAGCEAVGRGVPYAASAVHSLKYCDGSSLLNQSTGRCPFPKYDRVFVMAQYDDTQIGQFMQESLPRLVYHIDFLLANPDIKIQFGFTKKDNPPISVLPHTYINFLGITSDRLINGTVHANQAYMPREGGCQDPGYNAWEVVSMRERLLKIADIHESPTSSAAVQKRHIVVVVRSDYKFTNNKSDYRRWWSESDLQLMIEELKRTFPAHEIRMFTDRDEKLMRCIACHVDLFYHADIVIGHHGAGLMNTLYQRRGGVVVEVLAYFDSRHAPLTGIFPRVSGIVGLHHYSYYIGDSEIRIERTGRLDHVVVPINAVQLVKDVYDFALAVGMDLH